MRDEITETPIFPIITPIIPLKERKCNFTKPINSPKSATKCVLLEKISSVSSMLNNKRTNNVYQKSRRNGARKHQVSVNRGSFFFIFHSFKILIRHNSAQIISFSILSLNFI